MKVTKRSLLAAAAALLMVTTAPAHAQQHDGHTMTKFCQGYTEANDPTVMHTYCLGFVAGALGIQAFNTDHVYYCLPDAAQLGILTELFARYLTNHPERRDVSASVLLMAALHEVYPCKTTTK
jgi:Rap1a immunity proteins